MLAASIRAAARRYGGRAALVDASGRPTSYAELDRRSDEVAAGLAAAGVSEGDVVALTLPSVPEYVIAYGAAAKLGAATSGVNPRLADGERAEVVDLIEPARVIESAGQVAELAVPGASVPAPPDDPDRPVAVVLTSGTTGLPKGAVFDERRIRAIATVDAGPHLLDATADWDTGGPMLASTEFAHVGFTTKLAWYLRTGSTQVLMERWRAADALRLAAEHRMRMLGGVPPQLALMLRVPGFDEYDLSSVERIVVGAGPASPGLRRRIVERFAAPLSVRYSSTESGGAGTGTAFDAPEHEALYTEGRPRGPIRVAVRDDAGRDLPAGEVGEVCLHTPTAMVGYWRDPQATAEAFWADGFLRTGDLGWLDEAGCLRLAGRNREMYVRGGYNVYPLEVEAVLSRHPAVAEVAVVPRLHEVMGEIGVAVVVPDGGSEPPTLDELRAFGDEHLARFKLPEALVVVDSLPLTAGSKVDRRALTAKVAG